MTSPLQFHDLQMAPLVPVVWLYILSGISALLLLIAFIRKGRGNLFRLILLTALIAVLANPSLVSETRNYLNDTALIIVDETDSQNYGNRAEQTRAAVQSTIQKLESFKNVDIQTIIVKNQAISASGNNDGTRLFEAREIALKSIFKSRLSATVLITDGQIHDIPDTAHSTLNDAGPVHVLLTGEESEKDRILIVEQTPLYGIVHKPVTVKIKVVDEDNTTSKKTVIVTAKLDGEIYLQTALRTGEVGNLEIVIPHGGQNFVEISASGLDGEISEKNNIAFLTINGIRDRLKVLLVSGEPHMGERGWRNILKSDPSVDLVHFTILRPPEKQDGTPINELSLIPFPIAELFERKLEEFDLVIFDRYRRRGVLAPSYLRNIVKYVENGGALLEAAGPSFATPLSLYRTPLASILPGRPTGTVFEQGYVPSLSKHGLRHPVTSQLTISSEQETWGRWFRMIDSDATGGTTLMTGPEDRPLLILQRKEQGRVAQLMSDHAWLWGRGFEGGGPQAELLRRTSHWLMQEPELEEEQLTGKIIGDRLAIDKRTLADRNEPVTITHPDASVSEILLPASNPGHQSGSIPLKGIGLYKLNSGDMSTLVAVGPLNPLETKNVRSTPILVKPILEKTGGGLRRISSGALPAFKRTRPDGVQATSFWFGLRDNKNYEISGYTKISLVPPFLAFILTIGALCLAWWRESR